MFRAGKAKGAGLRGTGLREGGTQNGTDTPVTSLPSENERPALPGGESKP